MRGRQGTRGRASKSSRVKQADARRRSFASSVCAVVLLGLVAVPAPSRAEENAQTFEPLKAMFHSYGDSGVSWYPTERRTWTGADTTFSVPLPDGRTVWIFSDSFLSPSEGCVGADPQPCHKRRAGAAPFVNNTFIVQEGTALASTLYGGSDAQPRALIEPAAPRACCQFYWMGDGTVEGDSLHVFVHRYANTLVTIPPSAEATDIATFSLPDMTLKGISEGVSASGGVRPWAFAPGRDSPVPIVWGAGLIEDGGYVYIYGTEEYALFKYLHVARVASGRLLTGPWEYFTGVGWSPSVIESVRVLGDVAGELSVVRSEDGYRLVASQGGIGDIMMYTAPRPEGPWGGRRLLYTPPERARGAAVYNAHEHPQYSSPGRIVLSYNVNGSVDGRDFYQDIHVYRPRFVEIAIDGSPSS